MSEYEESSRTEDITTMSARHMHGVCPFRGLPYRPALDDRCPTSLPCVALDVVRKVAGVAVGAVVHPTPIMQEDSYCWTCTHDQVREHEDGWVVSSKRVSIAGKRRVSPTR